MDKKRINRTSDNYRLLIGDYIRANLDISNNTEVFFCDSHHLAHAYSAFLASDFKDSGILVVDGLGSEQQTHSFYQANERGIKLLNVQEGTGIGALYTLVTRHIGFESGEEGKTMGLAAYGELHKSQDDLLPNLEAFSQNHLRDYSKQVRRSPSPKLKINLRNITGKDEIYSPYFSRLAYNLQLECEQTMLHLARECLAQSGSKNLCMAGGVALNCVANERIAELTGNRLFVQPAAGDTGIPIGLALYGAEKLTGKRLRLNCQDKSTFPEPFYPYTSDKNNFINKKISQTIDFDVWNYILSISVDLNLEKICDMLSKQKVGALYYEAIEIGPRALGHRSFIADCSDPKMKEVMNAKIKHREPYRPFAPVVLSSEYSKYFAGNSSGIHSYMLGAPKCLKKAKDLAPSIVHIDGTARVQSVTKHNGILFDILNAYQKYSGKSVLINTSFNDNNEPIVFSWLDAIICFLRTNCDFLVIDGRIVLRELIINIENELIRLSNFQKLWIDTYSVESIRSITTIGKESYPIKEFCALNAKLSNSNRKEKIYLRLLEFLQRAQTEKRILLTDNYHLKIIDSIDKIFPSSKFKQNITVEIIDDEIEKVFNKKACYLEHMILLYNCSIFIKSTKNNFYKKSDKLIDVEFFNNSSDFKEDNIELIVNSYEADRTKNISEWFDSLLTKIDYE